MYSVKTELKRLLAGREKNVITAPDRVPSAVLIPLYEKNTTWHVVFIQRTYSVKTHKGQISFPGGGREKRDRSLLETAVRESFEEIGLRPGDIELLGELDDQITTTSNYVVTPFVASIPWPYDFKLNRREVAGLIEAPLSVLLDKETLKPHTEYLDGRPMESFAYHYDGNIIWGATARILARFLEIYRQVT